MSNTLGQILAETQKRNEGMLSHKEMVMKAEKEYEATKKALQLQHFFALSRLKVMHLIKIGDRVEISTRDLNKMSCTRYISRKNDFEVILADGGKDFVKWLRTNGLQYKLTDDHDGVGMESWVTMNIMPVPSEPIKRSTGRGSPEYGGPGLYRHD